MAGALELLYERLKKLEDESRSLYLAALTQQRNFEQQLAALDRFRGIYSSDLVNKGMSGPISHGTYEHYTAFIGRLDNISAEQLKGLQKIKAEVATRLQAFKIAEARRKGVEMLMEKRRLEAATALAKQEQKLSDDLSTNRFFQKSQTSSADY